LARNVRPGVHRNLRSVPRVSRADAVSTTGDADGQFVPIVLRWTIIQLVVPTAGSSQVATSIGRNAGSQTGTRLEPAHTRRRDAIVRTSCIIYIWYVCAVSLVPQQLVCRSSLTVHVQVDIVHAEPHGRPRF
jgi:hypothetical protein